MGPVLCSPELLCHDDGLLATVGPMTNETTASDSTVRERLRAGLTRAMSERDMASVRSIRSALGAIDNAEAVDESIATDRMDDAAHIAGAVAGAGSTEVRRRSLTDADVADVLRHEIAERNDAAADYDAAGAAGAERAALLRAEAATLETFLTA